MKKNIVIILAAVLLCLACLSGCRGYVSHYNAFGLVTNNTSRSAYVKFGSLSGTLTFQLKAEEGDGTIVYSGSLGSGSISVYYDCGGVKELLFKANAGETVDSEGGRIVPGTVCLVVETEGTCRNGEFRFGFGEGK